MQCIGKTGEGAPLGRLRRQRIGRQGGERAPGGDGEEEGKRRMKQSTHSGGGAGADVCFFFF